MKSNGVEPIRLSRRVIGAAIEVHRGLGPGFLEQVYESALTFEFDAAGIPYERQVEYRIVYKGRSVGLHRLDLVVEGALVVELKAIRSIEPVHYGVVRSYLRAAGLAQGLLLNFGAAPLDVRHVTLL